MLHPKKGEEETKEGKSGREWQWQAGQPTRLVTGDTDVFRSQASVHQRYKHFHVGIWKGSNTGCLTREWPLINLRPRVLKNPAQSPTKEFICVCWCAFRIKEEGEFHAPAPEAGTRGGSGNGECPGISSPTDPRRQSLTSNQGKQCRGKLKGLF